MDKRIQREKAALRQKLRTLAEELSEGYIENSDLAIQKNLLALDVWRQAKTVFIYVSIGREPQTRGIIQAALDAGKTIAVPRSFDGGVMEACVIESLDSLTPGRFGIPEPGGACGVLDSRQIELAVVPCVAADKHGYRLGHGGGYYDRYLANTECPAVCLCRGRLLQNTLPHNILDILMDIVVTETESIRRF